MSGNDKIDFVAVAALNEGRHFAVEYLCQHIGVVLHVVLPPVPRMRLQQLHLIRVREGVQAVDTRNRALRFIALGRRIQHLVLLLLQHLEIQHL